MDIKAACILLITVVIVITEAQGVPLDTSPSTSDLPTSDTSRLGSTIFRSKRQFGYSPYRFGNNGFSSAHASAVTGGGYGGFGGFPGSRIAAANAVASSVGRKK